MARTLIQFVIFISPLFLLTVYEARAQQFDHQLVRRLVVFPIKVQGGFEAAAEEAWWQVRDEFTRSRRFLVASKQFMVRSDVFQPRSELAPADAIILGKLLDAHALATFDLQGRELTMSVYDGGNGVTLYRKTFGLHPSLTVGDQLGSLARRAVGDFIASVPYQGFTVIDPLIGTPVYTEGSIRVARVDLGVATEAQMGDVVQWVRISSTGTAPLFQDGAKVNVMAEGKIIRIEDGVAVVEIIRAHEIKDIREYSLVRVPREAERLRSAYALTDAPRATLSPELAAPERSPMEIAARERGPLVATLSWVGSMAVFLLLAF